MKDIKEKIKEKIGAVLAVLIVAAVIFAVIAVISLFGGSVMKIFGFEYDSLWSIILLFVIAGIVGFPLDLFSMGLPAALVSLGKADVDLATVFYVILDTLLTAASMAIADYFMDSVSASDLAVLAVSFVFALTSVKDFREKAEKKSKEE